MEFLEQDLADIEDAKQGDDAAFGRIVSRHLPSVYTFVVRYLGETGNADDVVQETFLKAWRALSRFDSERSFRPWLFQIAKNVSTDILRKKRPLIFTDLDTQKDGTTFAETLPDPEPLPDEMFARAELGVVVEKAMKNLSPQSRLVLVLHYEQGFSFEEIAEIVGMPASTIRSVHRRALTKLRETLLS